MEHGGDRELGVEGVDAGEEVDAVESDGGTGGAPGLDGDPRALHGRAVAVVSRAIDDGDVDVALRVLALGEPGARRRRRWRTGLAMGAVAVVALVAGVLVGSTLNGGSVGEDAPEPLAFGDLQPTAGDVAAGVPEGAAATEGLPAAEGATLDPAATADPGAVPAEVLGTSITAPAASSPGAATGSTRAAAPAPPTTLRPAGAAAPAPAAASPAPTATAPPATAAPTTAAPRVGALDGSWAAGASQAGYRISKTWTFGGSTEEVVGRTARVVGGLTIAGDRLTAANVLVDTASIDSGNIIRDAAFRDQLLLTGGYPDARFDLAAPIDLSARPAPGQVFSTRASGKLRIRGVVRDVVADIQARQNGTSLQVIGSIAVKLADFGIPNPSFALATVSDQATVEFSVTFNRA